MRGGAASPDLDVRYEGADVRNFEAGLKREWLVTNGLGGYASGTVLGMDTRQYHALLVAALAPPVRRMALLVRLNEAVSIDDDTMELMTAEYGDGTIFPEGYHFIESFAMEGGLPTWTFRIGNGLLRRVIWMVPGHNVTVVRYKLAVGGEPVNLALRPLCAARDHHSVQRADRSPGWSVDAIRDEVVVRAGAGLPPLWLRAPGAAFLPAGDWYWRILLREERARGYDHIEDLFQPGTFRVTLRPGRSFTFIASAEEPTDQFPDPDGALARHRSTYARHAPAKPTGRRVDLLAAALAEAANQFIVPRTPTGADEPIGTSLIAGYHWFTDYIRDALIALPGILLGNGRVHEAAALLRLSLARIQDGLIPSQFPEYGDTPVYDAVDAGLLLFPAVRSVLHAGADRSLLTEFYPGLREIARRYAAGTRHGIGMDPRDGLLRAGEHREGSAPTHLTWMNAHHGDHVFTPRIGKPVEVNALWIAALVLMTAWAPEVGDDPAPYQGMLELGRISFAERFWYEEGGYLYDVIDGPAGHDASLRPNQLFALSLFPALITAERAERALSAVEEQLLTPYGPRSLAPTHGRYIGQCVGDQEARDRAFHQGTVWPWLLGAYVDAHHQVRGRLPDLDLLLDPFVEHLREAGLGTVSQIFDGDAPHTPRGAIAQAWSVAELLRLARLAQQ